MTPRRFQLDRPVADEVLDRFRSQRVVVLGDVMLDCYMWGAVSRISPEAPVPIVDVDRESARMGGAANVAANIAALGGEAALIGLVGADAAASQLRERMASHRIADDWLVVDGERPTTRKTRVVANNQQVVRFDQEDASDVAGSAFGRLLEHVERALADAGALIVSDYGKGVIHAGVLSHVLVRCAELGVAVCVDPKESHFDAYRPVDVITPNLLEASRAMAIQVRGDDDLEAVGFGLLERLQSPAVLVTRGEHGMSLFQSDGSHTHLPAVAQEVFDVTGAGDTVVSVYALSLAAGATHTIAAAIANHAAGLVIREVGTATTTVEQIVASIEAPHPAEESAGGSA